VEVAVVVIFAGGGGGGCVGGVDSAPDVPVVVAAAGVGDVDGAVVPEVSTVEGGASAEIAGVSSGPRSTLISPAPGGSGTYPCASRVWRSVALISGRLTKVEDGFRTGPAK